MFTQTLKRFQWALPCSVATLILAGCLGQSAEEPTAYAQQVGNRVPVFTSAASWEIAEGQVALEPYVAQAQDEDGDTLAYSLSPDGYDAQFFHIDDQTGDLRFTMAPNHQQPLDEDQNNEYTISVVANDGKGGTAELDLRVWVLEEGGVQAQTFNTAPFFLEQEAVISVSYDTRGVIYTAQAIDPEGDPISYGIKYAGMSPESYSMDAKTGALSLIQAPSHGLDSDSLVLVASDGKEFYGALHIRFHDEGQPQTLPGHNRLTHPSAISF